MSDTIPQPQQPQINPFAYTLVMDEERSELVNAMLNGCAGNPAFILWLAKDPLREAAIEKLAHEMDREIHLRGWCKDKNCRHNIANLGL